MFVFGISDIGVEYLWQDTPDEFVVDSRSVEDWHKNFDYKENIFDCEDIKNDDSKLYKKIKEMQQMIESLSLKKIRKRLIKTKLITQSTTYQTHQALSAYRLAKIGLFA